MGNTMMKCENINMRNSSELYLPHAILKVEPNKIERDPILFTSRLYKSGGLEIGKRNDGLRSFLHQIFTIGFNQR